MEITFDGKRALVTGAGQGIGKGIATELAKCGAQVVALDISKDLLEKLKEEIPSIEILTVDLSDWGATKQAVKSVLPIDLLVNNAGIGLIHTVSEIDEQTYDQVFNVNTKAVINVSQIVVDELLERKAPGSIVNISSKASQAALMHHTIYCASKAAVDGFTRALALDVGPHNIRANCVNPTAVMTDLGRRIWGEPSKGGPLLEKIPLNRFAAVSDVTNAVLFLLSEKASMITGSCIAVDGGYLAC